MKCGRHVFESLVAPSLNPLCHCYGNHPATQPHSSIGGGSWHPLNISWTCSQIRETCQLTSYFHPEAITLGGLHTNHAPPDHLVFADWSSIATKGSMDDDWHQFLYSYFLAGRWYGICTQIIKIQAWLSFKRREKDLGSRTDLHKYDFNNMMTALPLCTMFGDALHVCSIYNISSCSVHATQSLSCCCSF